MARLSFLQYYCISTILFLTVGTLANDFDGNRKPHIVYMGSLPKGEYSPSSHHLGLLQQIVDDSTVGTNVLIRSYERSFNGFAALLTEQEQQKLIGMEGVVSVFPSKPLKLLTTRSWDFMGFSENVTRNPSVESDVIIGLLDTGIWPESESFKDTNFGPSPKKWKGACNGGKNFTCNNKLIGARYYVADKDGNESARDIVGHGSHTASTAAGNRVKGASFYGIGKGMARGGVPSERIAMYKVCSDGGCTDEALLAGFDDAIADGVDLISISIGGSPTEFLADSIAIGAFHAMEKGILVVNSAGNGGPFLGSVSSVAPWLLTVAASSIDRRVIDKVVLDDGRTFIGRSVNSFTLHKKSYPLIYGKDATKKCDESAARNCEEGCLDKDLVKGKIVLCDDPSSDASHEAFASKAIGIITEAGNLDVSFVVVLPSAALSPEDYGAIKKYMNSTRPRATITKSITIHDSSAPLLASFSSRGPNIIVPDILKPDITAPGIDILAAYSPIAPPSGNPNDKRSVKYNIISGTSMSCPHVAGVAGYIKSLHPNWSSSAIKSALITTAHPLANKKNPDRELGYGAGHIDPLKAINPGLVYESSKEDHIKFLCGMGFDDKKLRQISGQNITCPQQKTLAINLNYPSLTTKVKEHQAFKVSFERVVTNVGLPNSTYKLQQPSNNVDHNSMELNIKVVPDNLSFSSLNEKKSFMVTVSGGGIPSETTLSESLVWTDGVHFVRSPIVVYTT